MRSALTVLQAMPSSRLWSLASLCALFLLAGSVSAAPVVDVNTERLSLNLSPYVDVLEDKKANLTLEEVGSETLSQQFVPSALTDLYFGYTHSAYWLRFGVENHLKHDKPFVVEVSPADIDLVDLYVVDPNDNKVLLHKHSGSATNFDQRDYDYPLYYFDVTVPASSNSIYYLRLESDKTINVQLRFSTLREHFRRSGARDWWQGFIFGALAFLAVIHLGLAGVFRYKTFAYYGLLLFSMVFIQGSWNGYFLQLHTDRDVLDHQLLLSFYFSAALSLLFARSYLNTHKRSPKVHRVLTALLVLILAGIPCSWLFTSEINAWLVNTVTALAVFIMFGVAAHSFLEGYRPARYFLLARTMTIVIILISLFSNTGLLPQGFVSDWGLSVALVLEGMMFALVMVRQQWQRRPLEKAGADALTPVPSSVVPVSALCHELRTPISGVMGMTELLLDTSLTGQQRLQAETIYSSGQALLEVVNKMSDLAALESGEIALVETSFEILSVVESCIERSRHLAERRHIELIYQVDEALAGFVKGDEEKLQQLLESLVSYGTRHLESGEILLTAKFQSQDYVQFNMVTGKNTFVQEYTPLHEAPVLSTSADTMNLTLARRFVSLMGGELVMQQRADGGVQVSFQVFLRRLRRDHDMHIQDHLLRGKRLLVVDDNDTCCKIVRQQATQWGMDVMAAASGKEALALLSVQANACVVFDLMLVDYDMPGMNGLELVARLRQEQDALKVRNLLILILTGVSKMPGHLLDKQAAGIHGVLYKPLNGKHLKQALIEALQSTRGETLQ